MVSGSSTKKNMKKQLKGFHCSIPETLVEKIRREAKRLDKTVDGVMFAIATRFFVRDQKERGSYIESLKIPNKVMGRKIK